TKSFHLNLGNDRANIKTNVVEIEGSSDFEALERTLDLGNVNCAEDIPKTLIFANTRNQTQRVWQFLRERLPKTLHHTLDFLHAFRRQRGRQHVMEKFERGTVRILVSTEAAGMGADIADIKRIIQFGAPGSLTVWIQHAGRAGRSAEISAEAWLLVEKLAFQQYRKKLEPSLRIWLEGVSCRRDAADAYFNNPPRKQGLPPEQCCDRCSEASQHHMFSMRHADAGAASSSCHAPGDPIHPRTPLTSTPSHSRTTNAKRPAASPTLTRGGVHRENTIKALRAWRYNTTLTVYGAVSFSEEGILSEKMLRSLANDARLRTIEDIERRLSDPPWIFAHRHGQEILDILQQLDVEYYTQRRHPRVHKPSHGNENIPPSSSQAAAASPSLPSPMELEHPPAEYPDDLMPKQAFAPLIRVPLFSVTESHQTHVSNLRPPLSYLPRTLRLHSRSRRTYTDVITSAIAPPRLSAYPRPTQLYPSPMLE
ncbi:hypothetical protein B0H21DRAFT_704954, partial [Amylocystis lapponica]